MKAYGKRLPIGSKVKIAGTNGQTVGEIVGVERIKPNLRWRSIYTVMIGKVRMIVPPSSVMRFLA